MKIRSITCFCNPGWPLDDGKLRAAGSFLARAKAAYEAAGYEVQTTRLATIPFPRLLNGQLNDTVRLAQEMARVIEAIGVGYVSVGPALPEFPESYAAIPDAIAASQNVFFGGVMADRARGVDMAGLRACADVIVRCAPLDANGFANLRFAALANVGPGAPFFPAAYHDGDRPAFALATEAADLAVAAFEISKDLEAGRQTLIAEIQQHGKALDSIAQDLTRISINESRDSIFDTRFGGIDFSLAPFPDGAHSLGNAVEKMGIPKIGLHGSLGAAALLTEAVDRADFPHTGFSGFMQPVLEDSVLALRAAEGTLSIKDLLLYSAVCGTGLDTVPLPGDATSGQIAALLFDLAALALRLDKPLTARLMPVPGKRAGEPTTFDFGFFVNSRVMRLESEPLAASLGTAERLDISGK